MVPPIHDSEVYCWLKQQLEPRYSVVSEPQNGYYSEWKYCYRILQDGQLIREFCGDFQSEPAGTLCEVAIRLVASLTPAATPRARQQDSAPPEYPIASRLPPQRTDWTWFGSGRAAFVWLVSEVVRPRRIFLPTYICWSLVNAVQQRFPDIELQFYSVNRRLEPEYPETADDRDALLRVHYFGHESPAVPHTSGATILADCSHLPMGLISPSTELSFGSLRKVYSTGNGGFLRGYWNPVYERTNHPDAWLRHEATDWRDLREAENMTDRHWCVSDISGQSLAGVLTSNEATIVAQRQANARLLDKHLSIGDSMVEYLANECPLLHNRLLPTPEDRDSLQSFLATRDIYCSVHWPVHPLLRQYNNTVDCTDAWWLEQHVLSFPVGQQYGERDMFRICEACDAWQRAGSTRFGCPAA